MDAQPRLVGRETERSRLLAALEHAVSGEPRAVLVHHKTVSSHVSNLLRKTGTTNRIELAALARRAGPTR